MLIEADRVVVRPIAEPDLDALMAVNGDEAVTSFLPYPAWRSLDDARAWYQRMAGMQARGAAIQLVVAEKGGPAVGTCLLFRFDESRSHAELGFVLGRAHWGRGYMREALAALMRHVPSALGLRSLEAVADVRNEPSWRLLQRLGFEKQGEAEGLGHWKALLA